MREKGYHIIHTREGHRPDLADLPRQQALALAPHRRRHRRPRPVRQDPRARRARLEHHRRAGAAAPAKSIIDKPGKGSFCATDLELILRTRGIENIDPDRHHHRRLRAHDDARGQRSRLRMPDRRGRLRRDRSRQPSRRAQNGDDAGRRVRRRRRSRRPCSRACRDATRVRPSPVRERARRCVGARGGLCERARSTPNASSRFSARPRATASSTISRAGSRRARCRTRCARIARTATPTMPVS